MSDDLLRGNFSCGVSLLGGSVPWVNVRWGTITGDKWEQGNLCGGKWVKKFSVLLCGQDNVRQEVVLQVLEKRTNTPADGVLSTCCSKVRGEAAGEKEEE